MEIPGHKEHTLLCCLITCIVVSNPSRCIGVISASFLCLYRPLRWGTCDMSILRPRSPKNIQEEFRTQKIWYAEQQFLVRIIEDEKEILYTLFVKLAENVLTSEIFLSKLSSIYTLCSLYIFLLFSLLNKGSRFGYMTAVSDQVSSFLKCRLSGTEAKDINMNNFRRSNSTATFNKCSKTTVVSVGLHSESS